MGYLKLVNVSEIRIIKMSEMIFVEMRIFILFFFLDLYMFVYCEVECMIIYFCKILSGNRLCLFRRNNSLFC